MFPSSASSRFLIFALLTFVIPETLDAGTLRGFLLRSSDSAGEDRLGSAVAVEADRAAVGVLEDDDAEHDAGAVAIYERLGVDWVRTAKILAPDPEEYAFMGGAIALEGSRLVVAATGIDGSSARNVGRVYLFEEDFDGWSLTAAFDNDDGGFEDFFGWSVDLDGDRILVGAPRIDRDEADEGKAFLYEESGGVWSRVATLEAPTSSRWGRFGSSVSVEGDRLLVGAERFGAGEPGAAFVYEPGGGGWTLVAQLVASDGLGGDFFGTAVDLDGNRALIGARGDDHGTQNQSGSAYVFDFQDGMWIQSAKLVPTIQRQTSLVGWSVALQGDRAVLGGPYDSGVGSNAGTVVVFDREMGGWTETTRLEVAGSRSLGASVALDGDRILAGAPDSGNSIQGGMAGRVSVFELDGPEWAEVDRITGDPGTVDDRYGYAVSVEGDRAVVGAWQAADLGEESGAAYVFDRIDGRWRQVARLLASDGGPGDRFGNSVSLSGDRVLVGAAEKGTLASYDGAAYLFELVDGEWTEREKWTASDSEQFDLFGFSVSLDGPRAAIGALQDGDSGHLAGSVYLFELVEGSWVEVTKVLAGDGDIFDGFGFSLDLEGDRLLVGAPDKDLEGVEQGAVYVYDRVGGTWTESAKLLGDTPDSADSFGWSVALDGDRALVGAKFDEELGTASGSAYVFERTGGTWLQTAQLNASDGAEGDWFGASVDLAGPWAVVGAPLAAGDRDATGQAKLFHLRGGTWFEVATLLHSNSRTGDEFGASIGLSGDLVFAGAPYSGFGNGSTWGFSIPTFYDGFESGDSSAWSP